MSSDQQNNRHENDQRQNTSGTQSSERNKGSSGGRSAERAAREPGESTASGAYNNETGDPGRTPGSAEGVQDFQKTGNE